MRQLLALVLLVQALHIGVAEAADKFLDLVVTDPYIEMHSGPGRGFPVTYVIGRDEELTVLYSRTDWFKVKASARTRGVGAAHRPRPHRAAQRRCRHPFRPTLSF